MEISFIHMQILVHLHVNKTNFHMKGFALGLALKQRRNANRLLSSPQYNDHPAYNPALPPLIPFLNSPRKSIRSK